MNKYDWDNIFPDIPNSFHNKVRVTLAHLPEKKESNKMFNQKLSLKKGLVATLAIVSIIGTTVFASGKIHSLVSTTSCVPSYTSLPSAKQVNEQVGFQPKLINEFKNGYIFQEGCISNTSALDENKDVVRESNELDFEYTNGEQRLSLSMEKDVLGTKDASERLVETYNGIDIYSLSYKNKCVPADYEMTEQDKQDEESGKYVFSYGSEEVEISQVEFVSWEEEGINYLILAIDSDLTISELAGMAHEVIDVE